ncbi:hypothetical protein [Lichenicoccus sp.]|uniref:hypothetical protein n=1 Tax=Lichenicoccus sp. TaxID=2781899 RepID=UPI003D0AEA41
MLPGNTTIFVGGASQMEQLLAPAISDPMIATGNIGLYGHLTGVFDMVVNADMQALTALWAGTAPGVEENGVDTVVAKQTITIKNTTDAAIDVPVGAIVSTASGIGFTVMMDRRPNAHWATGGPLGDGSWGHYVVAPGASIQVTVEANQDGPSGNVIAGAITTIAAVPGAIITASTAKAVALQAGSGTVTLRNTTGSAVVIASSDIVQGTAGVGQAGQYQVGRDPAVPGYQPLNADGSIWQYVVQPGAAITVPIYSIAPAYSASTPNGVIRAILAEDAPAGSITGGVTLPAGLLVTAPSAITPAGPSAPAQAGNFGPLGPGTAGLTDTVQQVLTTDQGFAPSETNVNVDYTQLWTPLDLANWQAEVDALRGHGIMNVAPVWSDNELSDVATSDAFANIRAAALYGGGIALDTPPEFVFNLAAGDPAYIPALEALIKWCTANGLRSSMILSPDGGAGVDPNLLANTQKLVAMLQAAGAMPSQFIVENYSQTAATVGDYFSTTSANALNAVAKWLATVPMVSTASESGLEVAGHAAADDIMTGVQPAETVTGATALRPYWETQIFTQSTATTLTATITIAAAGLGELQASAGGTISDGGRTVTISGAASAVQSALRGISFVPTAGAIGPEILTFSIADARGTIQGTTLLAVDDAAPPALAPPTQLIQLGATESVVVARNGDTVSCGVGNATISALNGATLVHAGAGSLLFLGGSVPSTVIGGSGSATIIGGAGGGVFAGGAAGHNVLAAGGGGTTLTGGGGGDALFGAAGGTDVLVAGLGRESLIGGSANATSIVGGLTAGAVIFTGGATTVTGGAAGGDTVVGGAGPLTMTLHSDAVFAGSGAAKLTCGSAGADSIIGGSGSLAVTGKGANIILVGGVGASSIAAGNGACEVFAGPGAMTLQLGAGPATVIGGSGSTRITEGSGAVLYDIVKGAAGGTESIDGFRPGIDRLALFGYDNGVPSLTTAGGNNTLSLDDGTRITLLGVTDPSHSLAASLMV